MGHSITMNITTAILGFFSAVFLFFLVTSWLLFRSARKKNSLQKIVRRVLGWVGWLAAVLSASAAVIWWSVACACVK
jgi:predicted membrane protein